MKHQRSEKDSIDKHVGSRIRMRRMMLGLSQTTLGDQLEITFQQVQKYEKGTNRVAASRLQHIADILKVPVPFFFEDVVSGEPTGTFSKNVSPTADINEFMATRDGLTLAKSFMKISNMKLRRQIVSLVIDLEQRGG
jgi:transcriptional regulator with XRE-family HTH domain